ncbi:MAG: hypothetical protein ACFFCE_14795 [Promethearchaeota archaeon]
MEIFEWIKEIEKVYENLIEKAKNENLTELESLREEQENLMEKNIENFRNSSDSALKTLTKNLEDKNIFIKEKLKEFKNKMKKTYNDNKKNLIELIIKDIGFDF